MCFLTCLQKKKFFFFSHIYSTINKIIFSKKLIYNKITTNYNESNSDWS